MTIQRIATHLVILASSGQAGALAGLEHNHGDDGQTAQDLDDGEDQIQCFHVLLVPFKALGP